MSDILVRDREAPTGAAGTVNGVVEAQLPDGLYQVRVDGARITAHVEGGSDRNFVRLLVGDGVAVRLTALDVTRGRIVRKIERA